MVRVSPLISRCIPPPYLLPFICDGGARVSFLSHIINGPAAYLIALPSLRQHYSAGLDRDVYTQRSCTQRAGVSPLHGGRRRRRRRPPPDVDGTCLGPRKTMAGRPSVDPLVRFPEKPPCRAPCSARNPLPPSCSPSNAWVAFEYVHATTCATLCVRPQAAGLLDGVTYMLRKANEP